ncbi:MAG TPA: sialidase family protein, partial [Nitrososphaeraceae archaeon]
FSKPIDISTKTEPFHLPLLVFSRPDIAASGNSVLVAWQQEVSTGNTTAIFLSKSTDGGNNFSKPIDISNNTKYALNPRLAISGNNRYAAWERSYEANPIIKPDIFLSKSTDGGNNFSKPIDISNNTRSYEPTIATSGNSVLVAWQQVPDTTKNTTAIFLSKSTDGGNNFSKPVDISNNTQNPINPSLAVYGNNVLVAWISTSGSNVDVFITKSTDGGNNFSKPVDISLLGFQK